MTDEERDIQRKQFYAAETLKRAIKTVTVTMTEVMWQRLVEMAAKFTPWPENVSVLDITGPNVKDAFDHGVMQAERELANDIVDDIAVLKEIIR